MLVHHMVYVPTPTNMHHLAPKKKEHHQLLTVRILVKSYFVSLKKVKDKNCASTLSSLNSASLISIRACSVDQEWLSGTIFSQNDCLICIILIGGNNF